MADKKISALDPATTPLAGTEVVPLVQSGSTKKVSVDNLTAGKAVSALSLTATNIKTSPTTASLDISGVTVAAAGSNTNTDINLTPKGTGVVKVNGGSNDRVVSVNTASTTAYSSAGLTKGTIQLVAGGATSAVNGIEFAAGGSNQMFFGTVQEAGGAASMVIQGYNGVNYRGRFTWESTGQWNSTSQLTGTYATSGANAANASAILYGQNGTGRINGFEFSAGGSNESFLGIVQEAGGAGALVFQGYNGSVYREYFRAGSNGDLTLSNGNLVIGTAGKGIDFSADGQAAGMTSELLDDYEEGTWTPNQGAGLTVVGDFSSVGTYTKIGRQVFVRGAIFATTSISSGSAGVITSNLPFVSVDDTSGSYFNGTLSAGGQIDASSSSLFAVGAIAATTAVYFAVTYAV